MTLAPRKTSVSFGVVTELTVANKTVNLILEKIQDRNVTVYRGGMVAGQRLLVVALLESLIPELEAPDSIRNLAITKMAVELRPEQGAFSFEATIANAWSITLDSGPTFSIDRLAFSMLSINPPASTKNSPPSAAALSQQRKLTFEGAFLLFGGEFRVQVVHQFSSVTRSPGEAAIAASQWGFSAIADGIRVSEIITAFGFSQNNLDRYGLQDLTVSLAFTLNQTCYKNPTDQPVELKNYTFRGELDWDTRIELVPGEETLRIKAAIQISKTSSTSDGAQKSTLQGWMEGTVQASIPFFDTLQLSVIYTFAKTSSQSTGSSSQIATRTGELIFQLQISTLLLNAVYTTVPDSQAPTDPNKNHKLLRFSVGSVSGDPKIGDLIAYIVSLYDPSITDFELDPPWDKFADQSIELDKFSLEIDLTQKTVTIAYLATLDVLIARVSNVGLSYQFGTDPAQATSTQKQARTTSNQKVAIALNLDIPGQPTQRVQWDPVNENPPDVPGAKAPIIELKFLALGQRVAFAPEIVQQARTIKQFTDVMRQSLVPLPPVKRRQNPLTALQGALPSAVSSDPTQPIRFTGAPIQFSAESGWLIGAQFSILNAIDLSVIFNDPFVYGVRIALSGPLVKSFAGLEFEILYRRISDTVGVYHTELVLPDAMRQLQFGAVSITLPIVAIDIYTNGDFGIDVGFPWGGDFSRSIAVEALIFVGVGGFYFNKLSAETATSVPVITSGTFDPVLEFGLGLKLGLGRTFNKGPLHAELSITLQGLLQGVIAWYKPTDTSQEKTMYYRVQGGVAIEGRIYGSVDFEVIQVEVEVIAKVTVLFVVEVYKAIHVALVAEVSVSASIKILFVRVSFSFSLTVREEFVLGSDSTPPWQLASKSGGAMAANVPVFTSASPRSAAFSSKQRQSPAMGRLDRHQRTHQRTHQRMPIEAINEMSSAMPAVQTAVDNGRSFRWDDGSPGGTKLAPPKQVRTETSKDGKLRLDLYFQPAFTRTDAGVSGIALLFIENSIPLDKPQQADNDTDFDELVKALFKWMIYAYLSGSSLGGITDVLKVGDQPLTLNFLEAVYQRFVQFLDEKPADVFWEPLIRFLSANFIFDISDRHSKDAEISGTIFPMFPQLKMALKDVDPNQTPVDFDGRKHSSEQISAIQEYFQSQKHNHDQATEGTLRQTSVGNTNRGALAISELLFMDYFTLIMRSALQLGIDHIREVSSPIESITLDKLLEDLNGGKSFQSLAGMTSRFLLHGLRIPTFDEKVTSITSINGQQAAYIATGQQFEITVTPTSPPPQGGTATVKITPNEIQLYKPSEPHLEWIRFVAESNKNETDNGNSLTALNYSFTNIDPKYDRTEFIQQIHKATFSQKLLTKLPELLPFYNPTPKYYTIRQQTHWQNSDGNQNLLWELPLVLIEYFKAKSPNSTLALYSQPLKKQAGEKLERDVIHNDSYEWATKLTLEVRRVSHSDTRDFLPSVYVIERIDPASHSLLRDLLATSIKPETLDLLHLGNSADPDVLTSHADATVFILKTDLSVGGSDNAVTPLANKDTKGVTTFLPFLRLILENSIAYSGHYYLNYRYIENKEQKGLPDALFSKGDTAKITLLMTFARESSPARYNNCINVKADSAQINTLKTTSAIFAESSATTNILKIPAGTLGFTLMRLEPEPDPEAATDELQNFYQLLSYAIPQGLNGFEAGGDRLPVGPVGPVEVDGKQYWFYEKVLPVYALTKAATNAGVPKTALPEILKDTLNPYYGIGEMFKLNFQWQDIYGNRLGSGGRFSQAFEQKLGYFDPILGISQWPSVSATYWMTKAAPTKNTVDLSLELAFDQAKYIPTSINSFAEAIDRIKSDRTSYQQLYYQIHDPNLSFQVTTSVIPDWSQVLDASRRSFFTGLVDDIYRYLVTLEYLKEFEYSVSETDKILQSVAEKYGVKLEDLANANSDVRGIFSGSPDVKIPVGLRVLASDRLSNIATKLTEAAKVTEKITEIVTTYAKTSGLLAAGVSIPAADSGSPALNYRIQAGDTFESIAIAQLAIAEDRRIEPVLLSVAHDLEVALMDGVFIKGTTTALNEYVTLNATLETVAYGVLQLENTRLTQDFEQVLAQRINDLVQENGLTLSQSEYLPTDTILTLPIQRIDADATITIRVKVITDKTWSAIAAAFPTVSITESAVILANADRQDLLITGTHEGYVIKAHDSLRHIATTQYVAQDNQPINVLRPKISAEIGALYYPIADGNPRTLATLTQQLHLDTNRHRSVLETVRTVGNISELLTEAAIAAQLALLAVMVSDIPGIFGDQDIIFSDLLLDYTVARKDSFDTMIAAAGEKLQGLTEQTTAADIAVQNPTLLLQPQIELRIPDRFTLALPKNVDQLAVKQSPPQLTSLEALANTMGEGVTIADVAIANQSLVGLLSASVPFNNLAQTLSTLLSIDNADMEKLTAFVNSAPFSTTSHETLYSLKSRLESQILQNFQAEITKESLRVVQSIGALNAIYEQLTFRGFNQITIEQTMQISLDRLRNTLFTNITNITNNGNLKSQLQRSVVHGQDATLDLDVSSAIAAIDVNDANLTSALKSLLKILHELYEQSVLKTAVDLLEQRSQRPLTVAEVGIAIANTPDLIVKNQYWIVPPTIAQTTLPIDTGEPQQPQYPQELMFQVNVQVEMRRLKDLMHQSKTGDKKTVPEAEAVSTYFSPRTIAIAAAPQNNAANSTANPVQESDRLASLYPFAQDFEAALPGLKLAVGKDASDTNNSLWAVHLAHTGVHYNIKKESPIFFAAAPLTNTLMSGTVSLYSYMPENGLDPTSTNAVRVEAVDLNSLARTYLRAIEDILKPEIAIPAVNMTSNTAIESILKVKERLATTISNSVTHVLELTAPTPAEYSRRQQIAVTTLRKELLKNLAEAYDIETIVQYDVDVAIANGTWPSNPSGSMVPRLSGQPLITGAQFTEIQPTQPSISEQNLLQSLDFSLSPAKLSLDGKSTLTFFFNTQTPQRYEDISINLMYQVNELEYNIDPVNSTSSWLNFVVPLNEPNLPVTASHPNYIGSVQIPIPLRDYPMPPSLIAHRAVPDPDAFSDDRLSAEHIRDWNYIFLYEHPDIAQDTIECRIDYNSNLPQQKPTLTIDDVTVSENSGTATFTVTLFPPAEVTVTVDFTTQDGTAIAGEDYTATRGTLIFAPGETTHSIPVLILTDIIVEDNEAFTMVLTNPKNAEVADAEGTGIIIDAPLLDTLVRFNHLYPKLANQLKPLETKITDDNRPSVVSALNALATLIHEVAQAWQNWQPIALAQASRATVHYNIDEDLSAQTKTVTIAPTDNLLAADQQILNIELPGYQIDKTENAMEQDGQPRSSNMFTVPYSTLKFRFLRLADTTGLETFGESSLPDRKITVINLDVLDYQNAWGAIRLARNKNLVDGKITNPAFIFQTPEIRFKNRVTPLIINDKLWNIGALSSSPQTLAIHLQRLFETLLPPEIKQPYDLRIACQYTFSLALSNSDVEDDLLSTLPVLLTPRFIVQPSANKSTMLAVTEQLRNNIVKEIKDWQSQKRPNKTNGRYVFSVSLFSHAQQAINSTDNPNLPLLKVERLSLKLLEISA